VIAVIQRLWARLLAIGRPDAELVRKHEGIAELVRKEFFETEAAFLLHASKAEYYDAMAGMLYHRRERLVHDPFNTRYFKTLADDDESGPPPPESKDNKGGSGGPRLH